MIKQQHKWKASILLVLLLCFAIFEIMQVVADPSGATISNPTTSQAGNRSPAIRNDSRSTITTMNLNSIQQTSRWKAYVGNVTGLLSLANANNYTIYSWDLTTIQGQVYASRFGNLSWTTVQCAPQSLINNESGVLGMSQSSNDRINATFNWTIHKQFLVGGNTIAQNTCNSTVTYLNSTRQVPTTSSPFQEILLNDTNGYLVYLTDISYRTLGYDNSTNVSFVDFQMIVPEAASGPNTPYYFYVELR